MRVSFDGGDRVDVDPVLNRILVVHVGVEPLLEVGVCDLGVELDAPGVTADPVSLQAGVAAGERSSAGGSTTSKLCHSSA